MDCRERDPSAEKEAWLPSPPPLPEQKPSPVSRRKTGGCCSPCICVNASMDRLFDEGYRADVSILSQTGDVFYAHAAVLGAVSPVFKAMFMKPKGRDRNKLRSIRITGVPSEAVRMFIRFMYSSSYEEENMKQYVLPLLVLSHAYGVPQLKRHCERWIEQRFITTENVVDVFQLALLCDVPRLSLVCHRFVVSNFKVVSASEGWRAMKYSHPLLEKEILNSIKFEEILKKERMRQRGERKVYALLYEAMEALVHICNDGCRTIGPYDKVPSHNQSPCKYGACKGLEALIRHFAGCKMRGPGGCVHCKRMWQILELHSRLCANPDSCRVPLCRNFRQRMRKQSKKEDMRWRILVKKTVRSKSITGAPFFNLEV